MKQGSCASALKHDQPLSRTAHSSIGAHGALLRVPRRMPATQSMMFDGEAARVKRGGAETAHSLKAMPLKTRKAA
jgi:hypothetical protein